MTDKERIVELAEIIRQNARRIGSGLVGYCQADFGDLALILVRKGYTRQLEPNWVGDFIPCQHCGVLILRNKQRCPSCGKIHPFNQPEPPHGIGKMREKLNEIFDNAYSKDASVCKLHTIFQRQKVLNEILNLFPEYEPVELETLGDEEIIAEYESWTDINPDDEYQMKGLRGVSQATIQHNSKGQLYRMGEAPNQGRAG